MRTFIIVLFLLNVSLQSTLCSACPDVEKNKSNKIVFGVSPWISSQVASLWSEKISSHFKTQACYRVGFQSKENYEKFITSALAGEYDIIDLPPHVASYLIKEYQFRPVAIELYHTDIVIFSNEERGVRRLRDLAGETIAVPDPLGLVTLVAQEKIEAALHNPPHFKYFGKHDRVVSAVLNNQAAAGVTISALLDAYVQPFRKNIHIIKTFTEHVDGIVVARPKLDDDVLIGVRDALVSFKSNDFTLWKSWKPVSEAEIKELHIQQEPYVGFLKRHFKSKQ